MTGGGGGGGGDRVVFTWCRTGSSLLFYRDPHQVCNQVEHRHQAVDQTVTHAPILRPLTLYEYGVVSKSGAGASVAVDYRMSTLARGSIHNMHSPAMLGEYLGIPCPKRGKDKGTWTVVNSHYAIFELFQKNMCLFITN